jgi:hypothetical protein
MALSLFANDLVDRHSAIDDWNRAMSDWRPTGEPAADGDPVPRVGIVKLTQLIENLSLKFAARDTVERVIDLLSQINLHNERYASALRGSGSEREIYRDWENSVGVLVERLLREIRAISGHAEG